MTHIQLYELAAAGLIGIGGFGLLVLPHLMRKIMALNVLSSGTFLLLVGMAASPDGGTPDPVPQAMVLTGIVVSLSATALGLAVLKRYHAETGRTTLVDDDENPGPDREG